MSNFGYCELQVDLNTGMKIQKAIDSAEVEQPLDLIPANKLHATIMYDERNPDIFPSKSNKVYKAKVKGVKTLGDPNSRWYAAALVLECPAIQSRHKQLLDEGFKHSYDDLLLHVSLCYGKDTDIVAPLLEKLMSEGKFPDTITLCNETWEHCGD
ncbi:RNA ligase [Klebsiella phage N1M2]|uniref:Anti-CBASS protein Acb1 n=1 Tax=Klebsiella phage N1M2 TaxID=2664939 RepID=A0A6B7ZEH1_9CAUD|nr:RNA ligase [Klebsiella phage N1M2]QGH71903.1 RNA ligase [Klebsiella phage N1M2]